MSVSPLHLSQLSNAVNLQRLFVLRNIAIVGQVATVVLVARGLGIALPFDAMASVIIALALLNLLTRLRLRRAWPVNDAELFAQLMLDVLALTVLLYFSGGSTNPFILLYLLPITLTAAGLARLLYLDHGGHHHSLL